MPSLHMPSLPSLPSSAKFLSARLSVLLLTGKSSEFNSLNELSLGSTQVQLGLSKSPEVRMPPYKPFAHLFVCYSAILLNCAFYPHCGFHTNNSRNYSRGYSGDYSSDYSRDYSRCAPSLITIESWPDLHSSSHFSRPLS